jgi:hypothetical protein
MRNITKVLYMIACIIYELFLKKTFLAILEVKKLNQEKMDIHNELPDGCIIINKEESNYKVAYVNNTLYDMVK